MLRFHNAAALLNELSAQTKFGQIQGEFWSNGKNIQQSLCKDLWGRYVEINLVWKQADFK